MHFRTVFLVVAATAAFRLQAAPVVAGFERFHRGQNEPEAQVEAGLLLLTELSCVSCHRASDEWRATVPERARLSLTGVGSRLSADALARFVHDPSTVKPGTLMPTMLAPSDDAHALVAYLGSLQEPVAVAPPGDVESGRRIYRQVGCVACHAPETGAYAATASASAPAAAPLGVAVPLALAAEYDRAALVQFLLNPLATRPAGRMPSSGLSAAEAADVAAYLQRSVPPRPVAHSPNSSPVGGIDAALVEQGRRQFQSLGCVACHRVDANDVSPASLSVPTLSEVAIRSDQGCLSDSPTAPTPNFRLDEEQRQALRAALGQIHAFGSDAPAVPAPVEVARFMARMNCYACHARDGRGGVEPGRAEFFVSTDSDAHSLGDFGHLPPALEHTGRKLTREWWEKVLWGEGGGVRPYLATRMPKFGREASAPVLDAWVQADRRPEPIAIDTTGQKLHQRAHHGRTLMDTSDGGLGCITCHGLRDRKSLGVQSINLTQTVARLQPEYFKELLLNPQFVQPGTLMPPMFMGRVKADAEIEQLWTFLKEIDQVLLPEGLLQKGEYELKPEKDGRPIVFRTFLDGAGLEAVAVGFPTRRHAAFDAAEVRWAMSWRGRFMDALTTWEERAMTPAKPLGESVTIFPATMPFARLPSPDSPWPTAFGTSAGYRYGGFTLGPDGTPTFRYSVGPLQVEDTVRADPETGGFGRRLVVRGLESGWYFRGVEATSVPVPVRFDSAGSAVFEETWP